MYVKIRRRHHANHTYEYVDIVESLRIDGKVVRETPAGEADEVVELMKAVA